jgi:importin subunit beta-1
LNEVVRISTQDTAAMVMQLVPVIMQKLNHTLEMAVLSSDDREKQSELQALLCGVLQASAKPVLMISNGCSQ